MWARGGGFAGGGGHSACSSCQVRAWWVRRCADARGAAGGWAAACACRDAVPDPAAVYAAAATATTALSDDAARLLADGMAAATESGPALVLAHPDCHAWVVFRAGAEDASPFDATACSHAGLGFLQLASASVSALVPRAGAGTPPADSDGNSDGDSAVGPAAAHGVAADHLAELATTLLCVLFARVSRWVPWDTSLDVADAARGDGPAAGTPVAETSLPTQALAVGWLAVARGSIAHNASADAGVSGAYGDGAAEAAHDADADADDAEAEAEALLVMQESGASAKDAWEPPVAATSMHVPEPGHALYAQARLHAWAQELAVCVAAVAAARHALGSALGAGDASHVDPGLVRSHVMLARRVYARAIALQLAVRAASSANGTATSLRKPAEGPHTNTLLLT